MGGRLSTQMYEAKFTSHFLKATKKVDKTSLRKILMDIEQDPYNAHGSHTLSANWEGFRAADFKFGDRIIYRICEECVQKHQETLHPLQCCSAADILSAQIIFVDFGNYHQSAGNRRLSPSGSYSF